MGDELGDHQGAQWKRETGPVIIIKGAIKSAWVSTLWETSSAIIKGQSIHIGLCRKRATRKTKAEGGRPCVFFRFALGVHDASHFFRVFKGLDRFHYSSAVYRNTNLSLIPSDLAPKRQCSPTWYRLPWDWRRARSSSRSNWKRRVSFLETVDELGHHQGALGKRARVTLRWETSSVIMRGLPVHSSSTRPKRESLMSTTLSPSFSATSRSTSSGGAPSIFKKRTCSSCTSACRTSERASERSEPTDTKKEKKHNDPPKSHEMKWQSERKKNGMKQRNELPNEITKWRNDTNRENMTTRNETAKEKKTTETPRDRTT